MAISVLVSCKIEKRLHRPGYHVEWHKKPKSIHVPREKDYDYQYSDITVTATADYNVPSDLSQPQFLAGTQVKVGEEQRLPVLVSSINAPHRLNKDSIRCDTIIYINDESAVVKVVEITQRELRYEPCGENVVPETKSIQLKYVSKVVYANGQEENFLMIDEKVKRQPSQREGLEIFGLISVILNVVGLGLLVFPFGMYITTPIGLVALIHAVVSLNMFRKHSDITGKGFAIAGLIIGILMIALGIYFLQAFIL